MVPCEARYVYDDTVCGPFCVKDHTQYMCDDTVCSQDNFVKVGIMVRHKINY